MLESKDCHRERFASLQLPLRSVGIECSQRPSTLMGEGKVFGAGSCSSEFRSLEPRVDFSLIELGMMTVLAGKTTPLACREEGPGISSVTVCYQGSPTYKDESCSLRLQKGGILMNPRQGGELRTGFLSSFNFPMEHQRLQRTLRAMQGEDSTIDLDQAILLDPGDSEPRNKPASLLAAFSPISIHCYAKVAMWVWDWDWMNRSTGLWHSPCFSSMARLPVSSIAG